MWFTNILVHSSLPRVCSLLLFFFFFPTILRTNFLMRRFFSPKLLDVVFIIEKGLVQKNQQLLILIACKLKWQTNRTGLTNAQWTGSIKLETPKHNWNYYTFLFTHTYAKKINFLLKKTYQSIGTYSFASVVPSSSKVSKSFCKIA